MQEKLSKSNHSLEKAFQIIEAIAQNRGPMRLTEIAQAVGMPASTTLRMLITLVNLGYAFQNPKTQLYALSLKFTHIGAIVSEQHDVREIAHPYLLELSRTTNETVCLAIDVDMEVVYIDVIEGPNSILKVTQRIGKRAPMHSTGIGKLLLLDYSAEKLETLYRAKGLERFTEHTIASPEALGEELQKVRTLGYARDNMECELGATCVAAPIVRYDGRIIAGISVSTPVSRMAEADFERILPAVRATADAISDFFRFPLAPKKDAETTHG